MVERWTCNQKIGGSDPLTVILRTSVPGIFSHFQDKKSRATSFCTLGDGIKYIVQFNCSTYEEKS